MIFIRAIAPLLLAAALTAPALAFEPIISLPDQRPAIKPSGVTDYVIATREQTDGQLGMVTLGSPPGSGPGPAIVNTIAADYWFVIDGTFEFHVGDKVFEGGPGTLLAVDAGTPHGYIAKTEGHILSIFNPGGYEHFFEEWERLGLNPGPELGKLENQFGVTRPAP